MEIEKNGIVLLPFTPQLWLTVLITMTLLAVSLHVTRKCSMKNRHREIKNVEENFVSSALYVLGSLSMQGWLYCIPSCSVWMM
jgi:hypothetical protein